MKYLGPIVDDNDLVNKKYVDDNTWGIEYTESGLNVPVQADQNGNLYVTIPITNSTSSSSIYSALSAKMGKKLGDETFNLAKSLAEVEPTLTTSDYSIGDILVYDKKLYKAITDISSGDYLEEGSNISRVTISEVLDTKINTSDIANNLTTTTSGKVLDARQGKALNEARHVSFATKNITVSAASTWYTSGLTDISKSGWTAQGIIDWMPHSSKLALTKAWITSSGNLDWVVCTVDKTNVTAGTFKVFVMYTN